MSQSPTHDAPPAALPYRSDIDGLRAIAVLAVVGFHAFPRWVHGGFVGVDIFFVISGFLISGIVFNGLHRNDFSFVDFYRRRVRRIFPALLLVLSAVYGLGWFVLLPEDFASLGQHIAGGAGFVANLLLWGEAGYFDTAAELKLLLHLWSLGIEEQFYFVWPLFLVAIWKWPAGRVPLLLLFWLVSFVAGLVTLADDPTAAFYSPLTRFWELVSGALLAYALRSVATQPVWLRRLARPAAAKLASAGSLLGAILLAVGIVLIDREQAFPGWRALLPGLGAVLVLAAGPAAWFNRHVLAQRWLVWVGLISFPLYLWHWPVLVFVRLLKVGKPAPITNLLAVIVAFLLAWATMRWIERPLRFGPGGNRKTVGLIGGVLAVGLIGYATFQQQGLPERFPATIRHAFSYKFDAAQAYRRNICFLDAERTAAAFADVCLHPQDGAGKPRLLLWGDSHAAHLYPGLQGVLGPTHAILQFTAGGCPPLLSMDIAKRPFCPAVNRHVLALVKAAPPDEVVLAGNWKSHDWADLRQTVDALRAAGVNTVKVIGPVPQWHDGLPRRLFAAFIADPQRDVPERMSKGLNMDLFAVDRAMRTAVAEMGAIYVSPLDMLCADRACLTLVGDGQKVPTAWDYGHLTEAAARFLVAHPGWAGVNGSQPDGN